MITVRKKFDFKAGARKIRAIAAAVGVGAVACASPGIAAADIQVTDFSTSMPATQAGATSDFGVYFKIHAEVGDVSGTIKDQVFDLPKGFIADPTVLAKCDSADIFHASTNKCSTQTTGGVVQFRTLNPAGAGSPSPQLWTARLRRVTPFNDEAAAFMVNALGQYPIRLGATVGPENGYRIRVTSKNQQATLPLREATVTMWGVPADFQGAGGFAETGETGVTFGGPLAGAPRKRFAGVPARCDGPMVSSMQLASWQYRVLLQGPSASLAAPVGCENLIFSPVLEVTPSVSQAAVPSGYKVVLSLGQSSDMANPRTPNLKDAVVKMPPGVVISPSSADGLLACTDSQLDIGSSKPEACPPASKIGQVQIESPVLDESVNGAVYVGSQLSDDPESGDMFRIFVTAASPGVKIKLRGQIEVDEDTGQLTAKFLDNPDQPFERMTLVFKDGDRASLANPTTCGDSAAASTFTSWAGQSVDTGSPMTIDSNCDQTAFAPILKAGTSNPQAADSSPFSASLARQEGGKELKTVRSVRLPEGLLGRVASVPLCAETQAAAGSCPDASRVGHVQIAAGPGSSPLWVPQKGKDPTAVYLAGPYGGAPYGLSIVVPAQAGPFDLGTVVVRSALHLDERTAQLSTGVDEARIFNTDGSLERVIPGEMPTVLKGVPLNVRELRVVVDREGFMVNPTDCSPQEVSAQLVAADGQAVERSNPYAAVNCAALGFAPKLRAKILDKGRRSTLRSWHPRTRFAVVPRKGDANIGGARVVLPSSTLLDQANIGTTCTRAQMAERACPAASIVGYAKAWSPLLRRAVEGPVYLAANGGVRPLPDLAAVLDGEIRVVLQGEISTLRAGGKARLQNTFRVVPDAPVSRFVLTMQGGQKTGLLVNSTDLCRSKERGVAAFTGQNNRRSRSALRLTPSFKGCGKVRRQAARRAARR